MNMLQRSRRLSIFGLVAALVSQPISVLYAQPAGDPFTANGRPNTWAVVLGAGAAVRPTFEGSDRYFFSPVPFVSINYRDIVSLDTSGLNAYWRKDGLQIGGGVTYSLGRLQNTGVFAQGDERLNGLGDIPAAVGLRGFASYRVGPVVLGTTFTKYLADGNNGILVDVSVAVPYRITDRTTITGRLFATWADQSYTQTYFGVTPGQSIDSGYAIYDASSGIKDVGLNVGVRHRLSTSWLLSADARLTRLTGYAEGSPITVSDFNASFLTVIGYRF